MTPVVDIHVHTYRTPEMGVQAQGGKAGAGLHGTVDELLSIMQRAGIVKSVMVNMTPVLEMREASLRRSMSSSAREMAIAERQQFSEMIGRQERRNDWTCGVAREHPELLAFIGLLPDMGSEAALNEIEDKLAKGAIGVKLHPASHGFYPNDPALWPVYRRCEELGLPVLAHGGTFMTGFESSRPHFFAPVLRQFPRLKLIIAHLGRPDFEEVRKIAADFPNALFDTSAAISSHTSGLQVPRGEEVGLIREIGVERVFFGSDFPWHDPERDLAHVSELKLTSEERQAILGGNAAMLLGISG